MQVSQSGIFTAQSCQFKSFGKALPKAIKSKLVAGKNSQFTANVGNLAGCNLTCASIAAKR
jgi:hypothetical protein